MIEKVKLTNLVEYINWNYINNLYNLRELKKYGSAFKTKHPKIDFIKNATLEELSDEDKEILKLALREGQIIPRKEYREKLMNFFFEK
jgi:hypothetical protein